MRKLEFNKTYHNEIECYKDKMNLFMVVKNNYTGKWNLCIANKETSEFICSLKAWGFRELYHLKSRKECFTEAINLLESMKKGFENYLFTHEQQEMFLDYYFGDENTKGEDE